MTCGCNPITGDVCLLGCQLRLRANEITYLANDAEVAHRQRNEDEPWELIDIAEEARKLFRHHIGSAYETALRLPHERCGLGSEALPGLLSGTQSPRPARSESLPRVVYAGKRQARRGSREMHEVQGGRMRSADILILNAGGDECFAVAHAGYRVTHVDGHRFAARGTPVERKPSNIRWLPRHEPTGPEAA